MGYLAELLYIAGVVLFSHALHRVAHVDSKITRKLIHILIGFVFFIQYYFFSEDILGLLLVPSFVTVGLFLVARFRLIPSMVNPENPYGIFYYALSITLSNVIACFYPPYLIASGAAILCLAFGDGFAALLCAFLKKRHPLILGKSVEGTLICFLFSALGMLLLGLAFPALMLPPWLLLASAALAAVIELLSGRLDNPAIVFGVGAFVAILLHGGALPIRILVGTAAGLAIAALATRRRILTRPGAVLAFVMLLAIIAFGGYAAAGYMVAIFAICTAVHILNKKKKNRHSDGARGLYQVACNGLVGAILLVVYGAVGHPALLVGYYAAVAEMLSDTLASDIGTLFSKDPVDICRLRRIPKGRSGGVSLPGTLASLTGCLVAFLLTLPSGLGPVAAAIVALSAFLGMLLDSVLGSLLQGKFRCAACGAYTEKPSHCGTPATHIGGVRRLDNSTVNLISNIFSAAVGALVFFLI